MISVWKRYFLKELFKFFLLSFVSFSFLYVFIDYASHTKELQKESVSLLDVVRYYGAQLACQCDILIPVSLMLATIKVLTSANLHFEIIALTSGGISLKRILSPFLFSAALFSLILFANFEFLQPNAFDHLYFFEEQYLKEHTAQTSFVRSLALEDHSLLIFQTYDAAQAAFLDAYWLKSQDEIYRLSLLYPEEKIARALGVDLLKRNAQGEVQKVSSYKELLLPEMRFDLTSMSFGTKSPKLHTPLELFAYLNWKQLFYGMGKMSDRDAEMISALFYKIVISISCFLVILAIAPFCLRFKRGLSLFAIYATALCGILTFFTLLHSSVILGESQVIPPFFAILALPTLLFFLFGWKYAQL
jgi:lipopolysaccharide export system permease protein